MFAFQTFGRITDLQAGISWSADDFAAAVSVRRARLAAVNVPPGATVVIAHSGSAHFLADLFAVWSRGCAAACLDPALTQAELDLLVAFLAPAAVLVAGAAPSVPSSAAPCLDLAVISSGAELAAASLVTIDPAAPALILFTSGTTGEPKGVVLSFGAVTSRIAFNQTAMGEAVRLPTLVTLPMSFGHGLIGNTLTPLVCGGDLVLHPLGLPLARNLGPLIDSHGIGFLSSVPALWRLAMKVSPRPRAGTLLRVHVGSAPLPAPLWREIADWTEAEVVNCYGVTELCNWIAGASSRHDRIEEGLVGAPWGGTVAVRDAAGRIQPSGEGELLVRSRCMMTGYFRRPDITSEAFVDGWYCTGDTGSVDASGVIRLRGRLKDEINRGGFKIQPVEIETLLQSHPDVAEACVFAMADPVSGEIAAAALVARAGCGIDPTAMRQWCATRLRREAIPERWFVIDSIPRNARGKVSRRALRQILVGETP